MGPFRDAPKAVFALAVMTALIVIGVGPAGAREPPAVLWMAQFGTAGADNSLEGMHHSTGFYVIGRVRGALPGQTQIGGDDVYLRKLDAGGSEVWTRQFGTVGREGNMGLFVHDTGVYTTGFTGGAFPDYTSAGGFDTFVRKYDFDGSIVWTRQFGTAGFDSAHGIAVWNHGSDDVRVYVAGWAGGPLPGQGYVGGATDAFLRVYDAAGSEVWTRQFGSPASENTWEVSVHRTGIYMTGGTRGAITGQSYAGGPSDVFVRKYDFDGTVAWTRQFGSPGDDTTFMGGIAADDTGVYLSGFTDGALPDQTSAGGLDAFVRRYSLRGDEVWTRQYGTPEEDDGLGISVFDGGVYVAGFTMGALPGVDDQTQTGEGDAFVRRYNIHGKEIWTLQFGTALFDVAFGIFADASGVYIAGITAGNLPGPNAGGDDPFVAKLTHERADG